MNKLFVALSFLFILNIHSCHVCQANSNRVQAPQIEAKEAYKGMFSVVTYNDKGNILHSGYGFFLDESGVGVASFQLFKDAYQADVIDFQGNKLKVKRILGASSNYDLVKFSTEEAKKIVAFPIAQGSTPAIGTTVELVHYTGKKKSLPITTTISTAENFESFKYYTISADNTEKNIGCPLLNAAGEVFAITQKNVDEMSQSACAIDARFVQELTMTSTSLLNADLHEIKISKGIPSNEKEALTYLYMLGYKDTLATTDALNDFVSAFPENAEGYVRRANFNAFLKNFEKAEEDFEKALELADNEQSTIHADEVHNNFSKAIYNKAITSPDLAPENWNMNRAIEEAQKAYELTPSPFYLLQQAHCYFGIKDYQNAYHNYLKINTTDFEDKHAWSEQAKAETWLYAARSYELGMQDSCSTRQDSMQVIALLDSMIASLPQPYAAETAPFFLEHAQRCEALQQYRKAVMDYYEYEKIIGPKNLNDKFYYLREQAELKCHMYQQALDDIQTAISYNPENPFYPVEKALIQLQAGLFKEAILTCEKSLKTLPENPDCYKIMGIAYGELKKKKQALDYLQKAQDLGDPTVAHFIQKYQ